MALSKTASPDDRTRFFRLGLVIIEELTPVLQDVLTNEISPSQIFNTVKQNKKLFQKLRPDQIDKINNAQTQGYKDFDITLLYTILRNLCPNIQEPTKGWGISEMPDQGDTTLGDDIERIRLIRNNIYGHISVLSVSETEFKEYWSTIFDICNRMQALLRKNYVQSLQIAEGCIIDSAAENMYMNKIKDLIDRDKSTRELLQRFIEEKDLSSQETIRIETKNLEKKKLADELTDTSIYILNDMVNSIHEKTSESEIDLLYESIEDFIREDNEESSRLASDPFFRKLRKKITTYASLQEENQMKILARFLRFSMRLKKTYTALLVSCKGSLLLTLTFTSERGYDLYKQDLERGEIGKQILEVLLYPPYLASFDLKAEDLVVYLNDHILIQENEPKPLVMDPHKQELKRCDLCKTALVQVQCMTCDIKLCNACIGEHMSSEETKKKHEIVKSNLPVCPSHDKEECKMFCNQCGVPLCFICIASEHHADHEISQILQVMKFNEKKEKIIKEQIELNDTILPSYQNIASDVENMIKQLEVECGNISTAITKQGEELHREIDQVVKKLQTEVEEVKTTQLQTLQKHLDEINRKISEIKEEINSTDVAIDSHDLSELFNITLNVDNYRKLPPKIVPTLPKFTPTTVKGEELCSLIGTISSGKLFSEDDYSFKKTQNSSEDGFSLQVKQLLEKPEIITIMKIEKTLLKNVACLNDDGIWTSEFESMKLYSISQGSLLKSIKTKSGFTPEDIAVTKHGHLVYTDPSDKTVNIVKNEEIETVMRLKNWRPLNVCSTSSGDLLVVMDSDDNTQSKVVRYSDSTEKQTIQFDDSKPLYSSGDSKYISENKNLDICVADCAAEAVVVVNQAGKLRFRYTGHTSASQNKSFCPRGITTDSQSHILTADFNNDCVHIIDQDGQFLTFIDCGLRACRELCMDTNDNLFVVQWGTRQVMKIKYLQ